MSTRQEYACKVTQKLNGTLELEREDNNTTVNVTGMVYTTAVQAQATDIGTSVIVTLNAADESIASSIRKESSGTQTSTPNSSGTTPGGWSYRAQQLAFGSNAPYQTGGEGYSQPQQGGRGAQLPLRSGAAVSGRGGILAASGTSSSEGGGVNTPDSSVASKEGGD